MKTPKKINLKPLIKSLKHDLYNDSNNPRIYVEIADLYYEMGEYFSALVFYTNGIAKGYEDLSYAYTAKAKTLEQMGDLKTARKFLEKALLVDPNDYQSLVSYCNTCLNLNLYKTVLSKLKLLLMLYPTKLDIHILLINTYLKMEDFLKAEKTINTVSHNFKDFLVSYEKDGNTYVKRKN